MAIAPPTPAATPSGPSTPPGPLRPLPDSVEQTTKLARYQLREYLRSLRFVILAGIVAIIGAILTFVLAYYHSSASVQGLLSTNQSYYGSTWGGGVVIVIVLAAVFFGGDAIAGEFQNKTGYFLMGLPVRRAAVYAGKYIAAFLASAAMLGLFLLILLANGIYYLHASAFPWQLGMSVVLALLYLAAALGATFLFSSLFKTSAYGFVLTAILFLFGFTLIQELIVGLVNIQPWMVISYADAAIGGVFGSGVNWGWRATITTTRTPIGHRVLVTTSYTAGIGEAALIMLGYFVITTLVGLWLFEREEFT